jgi:hypothetical protein
MSIITLEYAWQASSSVRYLFYNCHDPSLKQPPFSGLYSGIFALYLQCHASKTDTAKPNCILIYALCILYVLSVATIGFDIISFVVPTSVSNNERFLFIKNFALIVGWTERHYRFRHRNCSIHIIRLLRLHRSVHPSMRILWYFI